MQRLVSSFPWITLIVGLPLYSLVVSRWSLDWDSAIFITMARSLADGGGLSYLGYGMTKYPPGLPLLLAPLQGCDDSLLAMRTAIVTFAVLSLPLLQLVLQRFVHPGAALAAVLVTASSNALWFCATRITTEIPFLFFSLATLLSGDRWIRNPTPRRTVVLAALLLATCSLRLIGFALVPALVVGVIFAARRRGCAREGWTRAGVLVGWAAVLVTCWATRGVWVDHPLPAELPEALNYEQTLARVNPKLADGATASLDDVISRVADNATAYFGFISDLIGARYVHTLPGRVILILFWIAGLALALLRRNVLLEGYLLVYAGIYLLWPRAFSRFVFPIAPLVLYHALLPVLLLAQRLLRHGVLARRAAVALLVLVVLFLAGLNAPLVRSRIAAERDGVEIPKVRDYRDAISWVRDQTRPDAVIVLGQGPWCAFLAERTAISFPRTTDQPRLLDFLERWKTTHVIENPWENSQRFLTPLIRSHPERFREIHRAGTAVIYSFQSR